MTGLGKSCDTEPRPGLRERKKARTRASIREHALRLFREQGYDATTVDQIADAAEVSPSTFFRYFHTKEDVVLEDDIDLLALGAFHDQPADLPIVAAFRAAAREALSTVTPEELASMRETSALILTVPELRARAMDEYTRTIDVIAEAAAHRVGRDPGDFEVRIVAGAIIGVIMAATMPWTEWAGKSAEIDMFDRIDAALAYLEAGLPL
jgi:AcrR family transcriptional regulator